MHPALHAVRRCKDRLLWGLGFDRATRRGLLGSYMEMLNRHGAAHYPKRYIALAKMAPGIDPLPKARRS